MAEALILEFAGVGKADYDAVNVKLGIDSTRSDGDWPEGIVSHAAGSTADGGLVVVEVWESQGAQERFMESRLGPALHEVGLPAPSKVTWVDLFANTTVGA